MTENRKLSKGRVLSNLAFVLADVLESCLMDANSELKKENCEFKHEAKREFNLLLAHIRNIRKAVAKCGPETQEYFGEDSNRMFEFIKAVTDRCGEDDIMSAYFFNHVMAFPSRLGLDIDRDVFKDLIVKQKEE